MPMVGCRHDRNLDLLLVQQLAKIFIRCRLIARQVFNLLRSNLKFVAVDITNRDDLHIAGRHRFAKDIHAPPARADQRRPVGGGGAQVDGFVAIDLEVVGDLFGLSELELDACALGQRLHVDVRGLSLTLDAILLRTNAIRVEDVGIDQMGTREEHMRLELCAVHHELKMQHFGEARDRGLGRRVGGGGWQRYDTPIAR